MLQVGKNYLEHIKELRSVLDMPPDVPKVCSLGPRDHCCSAAAESKAHGAFSKGTPCLHYCTRATAHAQRGTSAVLGTSRAALEDARCAHGCLPYRGLFASLCAEMHS